MPVGQEFHAVAVGEPGQSVEFGHEFCLACLGQLHPGLGPEGADPEGAFVAVGFGVQSADQPVTFKNGKDIVAPAAFGFGHENHDPVVKPEDELRARPVAQGGVKGGQDAQAGGGRRGFLGAGQKIGAGEGWAL